MLKGEAVGLWKVLVQNFQQFCKQMLFMYLCKVLVQQVFGQTLTWVKCL